MGVSDFGTFEAEGFQRLKVARTQDFDTLGYDPIVQRTTRLWISEDSWSSPGPPGGLRSRSCSEESLEGQHVYRFIGNRAKSSYCLTQSIRKMLAQDTTTSRVVAIVSARVHPMGHGTLRSLKSKAS